MKSFYTQKDIDYSLENYSFKGKKNPKKYQKENYIKEYTFDIPKGIYDIFIKYFNYHFMISDKNANCGLLADAKLSTRIDKKTKRIIPIVTCRKAIVLEPGNSMIKSDDEAKELLNKTYEVFKNQYDKVKNEKHQADYVHSKEILYKLAKEKVEETDEIIKLKKKRSGFYKKINEVDAQINKLTQKIQDEKLLEVCNEIKKKKYVIPEEEIERFLCTTTYFEKSAIIQAVTEFIAKIESEEDE